MVKRELTLCPHMFMCLGWNQLPYQQKQSNNFDKSASLSLIIRWGSNRDEFNIETFNLKNSYVIICRKKIG